MKRLSKYQFYLLTAFFIALTSLFILEKGFFQESVKYNQVSSFKEELIRKEELTNKIIDSLIVITADKSFNKNSQNSFRDYIHSCSLKESLTLMVFKDGNLNYWSDNKLPLRNYLETSLNHNKELKNGIYLFQNGYYELIIKKNLPYIFCGFILVKTENSFQNNFLKNTFPSSFNIPAEVKINLDKNENEMDVYSLNKSFLFSLDFSNVSNEQYSLTRLLLWLYFGAFFLFILICLVFLFRFRSKLKDNQFIVLVLFLILTGRLLLYFLGWPEKLLSLNLFSSFEYASFFMFHSLADFLFNAILIAIFPVLIFQLNFRNIKSYQRFSTGKWGVYIAVLTCLIYGRVINFLISDLIVNSTFSLDLSRVFTLTENSFFALLIFTLLFFSHLYACRKMIELWVYPNLSFKVFALLIAVFGTLEYLFLRQQANSFLLNAWIYFVMLLVWLLMDNKNKSKSFSNGLFAIVVVLAFFSTNKLIFYSKYKEQKKRIFIAKKLSEQNDPIAEYLFVKQAVKIKEDELLRQNLTDYWINKSQVDEYIRLKYFQGYFLKYEFQFTVCSETDTLYINQDKIYANCADFFKKTIYQFGKKIGHEELYSLDNNSGRISYLAVIPIKLINNRFLNLYLEFDSKYIPSSGAYPDLLLDQSAAIDDPEKSNYSFAHYKNQNLLSKSGFYNYAFSADEFSVYQQKSSFIVKNGYSHYLYRPNSGEFFVLSLKENYWMEYLTCFSFCLGFYCLFMFLTYGVFYFSKGVSSLWLELKNRIPIIIIGIVFFSLLFFGLGSIYYIKFQFEERTKKMMLEKIKSVAFSIQETTQSMSQIKEADQEFLASLINKTAAVFSTDLNLFDMNGDLVSSSRKEIFEYGLIDRKMDSKAYDVMSLEGKTDYIQQEKIGSLEFNSAYIPIRSSFGSNIAFLNLPYFSRQEDLNEELSFFTATLLNIYIVLFVFSALIAIVIARYITEPLNLIRMSLSGLSLGKTNKPIEWNSRDEIGALIMEYNRVVKELSVSAQKLAVSERESAWREMARQVAHEIKNPLTPIKLGAQLLERSWKDQSPDFNQRISKFTQTLSEQIDSLVSIANEFSNFAQMPRSKPEQVNLKEVIESVFNFFSQDQVLINYHDELKHEESAVVFADREHLIRIFNNLIKNGIQAVDSSKDARVSLVLKKEGDFYVISVQDNGRGIPDDLTDKIFMPNFTTKSSGMGLGLAIVKSMIDNMNANISFQTKVDQGTVFNISIPVYGC